VKLFVGKVKFIVGDIVIAMVRNVTIFQSNNCNNFSSLMWYRVLAVVVLEDLGPIRCGERELNGGIAICYLSSNCHMAYTIKRLVEIKVEWKL
jgi:hypothetical protein